MTVPPSGASERVVWEELLHTEESLLAKVAAAGLAGLAGTLRAALDAAPSDTGAPACALLLEALDGLLAVSPHTASDAPLEAPSVLPPPPSALPRSRPSPIRVLAGELAASAELHDFAPGAVPPAPEEAGAEDRVRRWFHLTLLRLPERHAAPWRERAVQAEPPPDEPWRTLRGWTDEILLPPSGEGRPGIRTVRDKAVEPQDLARLVLTLAEYDEALCLLLAGLWTGGSERLADPAVLRAYRGELDKRLDLWGRSPQESTEQLRAGVSLDEALCSATHLPPGAQAGWWSRLAEESHATVLEMSRRLGAAGRNVEAVLPARPYGKARTHTRGDDIRLGVGGRPGDTFTCLRLWLRVDDQVFPGRVVYRGQE
ncbi:hypothetical protein AB0D57_07660 [Streptomyces sp. NPDC048275]|uniref:hypothetical protein n=1 Tax=Streptomyces sp. NPDC048275 TaxID=3155629 RepID=UPI0033CBBFF4